MTEFDPQRVLFVGMGATALCYYRCMLPATQMGADWCGVSRKPPKLKFVTGQVRDRETGIYTTKVPEIFTDYDIVVIQQPQGGQWVKLIDRLREKGIVVLFEIDDYLHGIKHEGSDHGAKEHYSIETTLSDIAWAMRHCDGIICSTDFIADKYRHMNRRTFVCRNGIDLRRYDLRRPKRKTVNIGWAGAGGHLEALEPWFAGVGQIMRMREKTCFVSVGRPDFAEGFQRVFGAARVIGTPWAQIEQYPGAMTMIDIALAPAARTSWWRGKSDLRWLEAGALGIPVIADPVNYPEVQHGETGFHAHSPQEATEIMLTLVDDSVERRIVGNKARTYIRENRGIDTMVRQWEGVFREVLED
jgi:glycosyltransferase involved in cell wall biosynthesis